MKIEWPRLRGNLRKLREKVQALELTVSPWAEKGKSRHQRPVGTRIWWNPPCIAAGLNREMGTGPERIDWSPGGSSGTRRGCAGNHVEPRPYPCAPRLLPHSIHILQMVQLPGSNRPSCTMSRRSRVRSRNGIPPNKFIASLNCDGLDHPVYGANLLALVGWFGAAKFGLSWFMEFCQIFGSPLRHGKASGTLAQKSYLTRW